MLRLATNQPDESETTGNSDQGEEPTVEASETPVWDRPDSPPRRGRGRPPGSTNKPKEGKPAKEPKAKPAKAAKGPKQKPEKVSASEARKANVAAEAVGVDIPPQRTAEALRRICKSFDQWEGAKGKLAAHRSESKTDIIQTRERLRVSVEASVDVTHPEADKLIIQKCHSIEQAWQVHEDAKAEAVETGRDLSTDVKNAFKALTETVVESKQLRLVGV